MLHKMRKNVENFTFHFLEQFKLQLIPSEIEQIEQIETTITITIKEKEKEKEKKKGIKVIF